MARVEFESFKLKGTVGGLTFIEDSRGSYARKKSEGPTNPSERQKNNSSEMGGASIAAKAFRVAFSKADLFWMDPYFSGRLTGAFRKIAGLGTGKFGKRSIDFKANGTAFLAGFDFVENRLLRHKIGGIGKEGELTKDRKSLIWNSPQLNRKKQMTTPEKATHFTFVSGAVAMDAYHFDEKKKQYASLAGYRPTAHFVESAPLSLEQKEIQAISLRLDFANPVSETAGVIHFVGVRFFWEINGEHEVLEKEHAMRILGVY